ncbi:hypothetical protein AXF42_Ash006663 [Apostasia shenzhenica]|uniref:Uncharacterized protein n=1 Tax=Apostasia shenzhenica TaxID=1088818 RepID=A0A2I0AIV2_9ASPA|nr:hypothetical protein AXF42_Ash006663 [Apostasia shenzhenica]
MGKGLTRGWSVFDVIKTFPSSPETLMAEIDAAIAAIEYAQANALLSSSNPSSSSLLTPHAVENTDAATGASGACGAAHDARLAEEAYRAARAALSTGRPEDAMRSIQVALASCPPDRTSAVAKLRSLLSTASSQLQKQKHPQKRLL